MAVYFFYEQTSKLVKIGYAGSRNGDPRQAAIERVKPYLTFSPNMRVWLLGVIDGAHSVERAIHTQFQTDRVEGEWFTLSPMLSAFIDAQDFGHAENMSSHRPYKRPRGAKPRRTDRYGTRIGPGQPRKYKPGEVVTLLLRLPKDLASEIDAHAKKLGIKRTLAIQRAIRTAIDTAQPTVTTEERFLF